MIRRVSIDGFRCLVGFDWRPERVNLLLGPNGGGKSAVFDALEVLAVLAWVGTPTAEAFPPEERTSWTDRLEQRLFLELEAGGALYAYEVVVDRAAPHADARLVVETLTRDGVEIYAQRDGAVHAMFDDGRRELGLPTGGARSLLSTLQDGGWPIGKPFVDTLSRHETYAIVPIQVAPRSDAEDHHLKRWGDNFVGWYRTASAERPEALAGYFAALRAVLPGFRTVRLRGGRSKELEVVFRGPNGDYDVLVDELSSGQIALVVLYAIRHLLVSPGDVLAFDEPDNYVASSELHPWLAEMVEWAEREGQLFVVSHHPEVIDYLGTEAVWVFSRPDGGATRVHRWVPEPGVRLSDAVGRGMIGP